MNKKMEQRFWLSFQTISRLAMVLLGAQSKNILWYVKEEPLTKLKI